ncbi:hypothetical protein [Corallococcus aberystwythensis]|uniref:Uncharacterized protein n=1 Tax=Corallococcus aberystwythensis TaxID=2316722 RepID=A0A3A8R032_9BACT|nr:hypothetical protein [Corallococcus aberystwythensis]RKH74193.1 hypothetical protein D7W81_02565 [Corallococcus aberystwythensis]
MNAVLPVLLALLAITDASFCGFRVAAGRDARIFKADFYRAAIRRGMLRGVFTTAAVGCGIAGACLFAPGLFSQLLVCARAILWVLLPYATLTLVGMGVWAAAEADVRTLASVVVLGPFTLIRPWVIAAAAVVGAWKAPGPTAALVTIAACGVQMAIEPWLNAGMRPRIPGGGSEGTVKQEITRLS